MSRSGPIGRVSTLSALGREPWDLYDTEAEGKVVMQKLPAKFWILGILLLLDAPVSALPIVSPQGGTARLVGQVFNLNRQPLVGAKVTLGSLTTQTDKSGTYTLEGLRAAQWEVVVEHPGYVSKKDKVWLYDQLTTALDATLQIPVAYQDQTKVGLLGIGSLAKTDYLAQQLAQELVRLKGFPEAKPLVALSREEVSPIAQKLNRPLAEILDRDRQNPALVSELFRYLGVKALVIARADLLVRPETGTSNTKIGSRSRVELWRFKENVLQIQVLSEENLEQTEDAQLNEAEAGDLLRVQMTKMANAISQKWRSNDTWQPYVGIVSAEPSPSQTTNIRVEILPRP